MKHHLIAPHPDDELFGAYTLLRDQKPTVCVLWGNRPYCYQRKEQSQALAKELDYPMVPKVWPQTADAWVRLVEFVQGLEGTLWLPSPLDAHPDHRLVSSLAFFHSNVRFYAILPVGITYTEGMRELDTYEWDQKQRLLREYFPREYNKYYSLLEQTGSKEYYGQCLASTWKRTMDVRREP